MSTIQAYSDATRPAASASNVGLTIFNTTTKDINVSDGAAWRAYEDDATTANTLSLEFDGNDRLDTTYQSTSGGNDFTISFWMKSSGTGATYQDIFRDDTGSSWGRLTLLTTPGASSPFYLRYGTASGNNVNGAIGVGTIYDNAWHHIAIVLDNSGTYTNIKIYKDGNTTPVYNADATTTNGWANNGKQSANSPTNYLIGSTSNHAYPYTGKLDQVAFFGSALTTQNITDIYNGGDIMNLGLTPEAYYRMGYYFGDTNTNGSAASAGQDILIVKDYSGNGYDASQATTSRKPNYVADPAS
jgi:hypothetical protein